MKKVITFILALLFFAVSFAQPPQKISYQAVVRNADGTLIAEQTIGIQISIVQGSEDGSSVYTETQDVQTTSNGLISLKIGDGTVVSGSFMDIDWANDLYFIKCEMDPAGSTNYSISGVNKLLSVPYAIRSATAESIGNQPADLAIGDSYGGGIVFYLTPNGKHGLIAAKQDQYLEASESQWFRANWQTNHPDFHDDEGKKYKDWRLPDIRELEIMYEQKNVIGGFVDDVTDENAPLPSSWYMSDSESYYKQIYCKNFATGTVWNDFSKGETLIRIRAVRTF